MQLHAKPCNSMQHNAISCNTMQYHAILCNTMQYNAIPGNTMQYHASLITADGAYLCPVGSIMAIFRCEAPFYHSMTTLKFRGEQMAPLTEISSYVIRTLKCLTLIKCYVSHQNNMWPRILDQLVRPPTPQKLGRPKQRICKNHFVFEVITIKKILNKISPHFFF